MNEPHRRHILGFPEMDVQHDYCYRLFAMIVPSATGGGGPVFGTLLREIESYLLFHFESEEHLMRMYEYPGFAIHQSDHEQACRRLVRFLDDYEGGTLNPAALSIFLQGWLMEHSSAADSGYVKWIMERRAGLSGRA